MTQNKLIEQIVEVLKRHPISNDMTSNTRDVVRMEAATEIAALHPLTKLREEVERLKSDWDSTLASFVACEDVQGAVSASVVLKVLTQILLSLLTQENDGWISVEDRLSEAKVTTCPDCLDGRDPFEPDWQCPDCRNSIPPSPPKSK